MPSWPTHVISARAQQADNALTFGREEAITALAAICARYAAGKVASPDGLLRCMVELHEKGSLRLDRTLFGLSDKLDKDAAHGAGRIGRGG